MSVRAFLTAAVLFPLSGATCAGAEDRILLGVLDTQAPLTAAQSPKGGMLLEIVRRAFANAPDPIETEIEWQAEGAFQRGTPDAFLPARQPVCDAASATAQICSDNLYSAPLAELVVLAFVRQMDESKFGDLRDLSESRLCFEEFYDPLQDEPVLPAWSAEYSWAMVSAPSLAECFAQLAAGSVDAVAADEYRGVQALFRQDLTETVVPLPSPLGTETLHMVIAKTHWRATAHLYRLNSGLAQLRRSGDYAEIVARHTASFWDRLKTGN